MRPCKVQIHVNLFLSKDSAPLLTSAAARPRDEPLTGTLTTETSPYLYCVSMPMQGWATSTEIIFSPKYTSRRERDRRPAAQPSRAEAGLAAVEPRKQCRGRGRRARSAPNRLAILRMKMRTTCSGLLAALVQNAFGLCILRVCERT